MKQQPIYLDHAAATPLDRRVLAEMLPFLENKYGNPSALYSLGCEASADIVKARKKVATCFNCSADEIIFTGGGTESDNLAIIGMALGNRDNGNHIITSSIEHDAVLESCEALKKQGFVITYLPVDEYGIVDPERVREAITEQTILVSIIFANNEIGTVEPIQDIAKICREANVLMHTDACQAAGAFDLDVKALGVDALTINGSKIYGPKGSGALFIRKGVKIDPISYGGAQEFSKRAGTQNIAGIVGLAEALCLVQSNREEENKRLLVMRDKLISAILYNVPKSRLNGHPTKRLPNNVNISFLDVEGEAMLLYLDALGICVSTGSACNSEDLEASHVLLSIGLSQEVAHGSLRFTFGKNNTFDDVDYVIESVINVVKKLRAMSALNSDASNFPGVFV